MQGPPQAVFDMFDLHSRYDQNMSFIVKFYKPLITLPAPTSRLYCGADRKALSKPIGSESVASDLNLEAAQSRFFDGVLNRVRISDDQPIEGPLASCGRLASPAR